MEQGKKVFSIDWAGRKLTVEHWPIGKTSKWVGYWSAMAIQLF